MAGRSGPSAEAGRPARPGAPPEGRAGHCPATVRAGARMTTTQAEPTTETPAKDYTCDPIGFIDDLIPLNEKRQPWRLSDYQRKVMRLSFRWNAAGRLVLRLLLW